ncbi:MAG: hypothetical protein MJY98_01730 [Fibrobacter sp.]|nr:hypothetical protein [Fibrobacter sp.]
MGFAPAILISLLIWTTAFAASPTQAPMALRPQKTAIAEIPKDTIVDTVYIEEQSVPKKDGIPWNRDRFDPEVLVRHSTFDPALSIGYTYSVSFIGGTFGSMAQQSYMAHLAYEFSPEWHLYADLGLWMPLYSHMRFGTPIAKEDLRQGNVDFILPDVMLEYKPNDNVNVKLMIVNENDAIKAYGPRRYYGGYCNPWRNSILCP